MVHPEIRQDVPDQEVGPAEVLADLVKGSSNDEQTEVTQENEVRVLGIVQWAARIEMVDATEESIFVPLAATVALTLVLVVTSDVGQQVHGPAAKLLVEEVESGGQRRLLGQFVQLMNHLANSGSICFTSLGYEHHVTLHMARGLVMLAMGNLPGEIGHHEQRVADPSDGVVQDFAGREGLVTAFMGQNPHTRAEKALNEGVHPPETSSYGCGGDVLGSDEAVGQVEDGSQRHHIAGDIIQASSSRPLEAVLWNGLVDVANGVVWDLEGIAIRVNQLLAILCFGRDEVVGREGRERRAGSRGTRAIDRGYVGGGSRS